MEKDNIIYVPSIDFHCMFILAFGVPGDWLNCHIMECSSSHEISPCLFGMVC